MSAVDFPGGNQLRFMACPNIILHQSNTITDRLTDDPYNIYRSLEVKFCTCFTEYEAAIVVSVSIYMQEDLCVSKYHAVFGNMKNGETSTLEPLELYENVAIVSRMEPADENVIFAPLMN